MDDKSSLGRNGRLSRRAAFRAIGGGVSGAAVATMVDAQQNRPPAVPATPQSGPVSLKDFGGICDGVRDDYNALAAAIKAVAPSPKGEITVPGITRIGSDITIPANIVLNIPKGAGLAPNSGKTIIFDGDVDAGAYAIFFPFTYGGGIRFSNNSPRREFFVEWWGPPWGGSADAVPHLTAATNAIPDNSILRFNTRGTLRFDQTWRILNRVGLTFSAGPTGEELPPLTITEHFPFATQESINATIHMRGCGHCTFEGFKIINTVVNKCLWMDQPGAPRISTNNTVRYCRFVNGYSTNYTEWTGLAINPSGGPNNEFMHIVGNFFEGNGRRGIAINVGADSNNHGHVIEDNHITDVARGITGAWSGYTARHNHFTGNELDIEVGHLSYPTIIENNGSEGSRQFYRAGAEGGESTVMIIGNRLAGLGANGVAWIELREYIGPTTIMGNDFQNYTGNNSRVYSFPWNGGGNPGIAVTLIGNYYGNVVNQGMPSGNLMVRTGNSGAATRLPITIIGEPLFTGR